MRTRGTYLRPWGPSYLGPLVRAAPSDVSSPSIPSGLPFSTHIVAHARSAQDKAYPLAPLQSFAGHDLSPLGLTDSGVGLDYTLGAPDRRAIASKHGLTLARNAQ